MMIMRPQQVRMLAMGLPATPLNKTSRSTSESKTTNDYQDKRNAVQGGVGISGDGNSSTYYSVNTDAEVANAAITGNTNVATVAINSTTDASKHLEDVGLGMLQANTSLANSLVGGALNSAATTTQIAADLAKTQVAAANDNRYLIVAGMAVVLIVGVVAFTHKV